MPAPMPIVPVRYSECPRPTVAPRRRLGQRGAVGVVVDVDGAVAVEGVLELGGDGTVRPSRGSVPTTPCGCRAPRGRARRRSRRRRVPPASVSSESHVGGQLDQHARTGHGRSTGTVVSSRDRAAEVDRDRGDVVDVDLEAEPDDRLPGEGHRPSRAAAPTARGDRVVLVTVPAVRELADDRADGGLRQAGTPGQLGARRRAVGRSDAARGRCSDDARARAGRRPSRVTLRAPRTGAPAPAGRGARTPHRALPAPRGRPARPSPARAQPSPSSSVGIASSGSLAASSAACTSGSARNACTLSRRTR